MLRRSCRKFPWQPPPAASSTGTPRSWPALRKKLHLRPPPQRPRRRWRLPRSQGLRPNSEVLSSSRQRRGRKRSGGQSPQRATPPSCRSLLQHTNSRATGKCFFERPRSRKHLRRTRRTGLQSRPRRRTTAPIKVLARDPASRNVASDENRDQVVPKHKTRRSSCDRESCSDPRRLLQSQLPRLSRPKWLTSSKQRLQSASRAIRTCRRRPRPRHGLPA
mmetsp:Transcript_48123/g.108096  ORF Transcript_48123/g.108096 Transcript_48123/m.108096 type:complete len:219 (+) Transcript_48123:579-1235(+)